MNNITIKTNVTEDGLIEQMACIDNVPMSAARTIIDTRDEQIKEALIELGWTPPPDKCPFGKCPLIGCNCARFEEQHGDLTCNGCEK